MNAVKCSFCGKTTYDDDMFYCSTCGNQIRERDLLSTKPKDSTMPLDSIIIQGNKSLSNVSSGSENQNCERNLFSAKAQDNTMPSDSTIIQSNESLSTVSSDKSVSAPVSSSSLGVRWIIAVLYALLALLAFILGGACFVGGLFLLGAAYVISPLTRNIKSFQGNKLHISWSAVLLFVGIMVMLIGVSCK